MSGFGRGRALALLLALAALAAASPARADKQPPPEMTEEEIFTSGKALLERGKEEDARNLLRRYEQRYPRGQHIEEVKLLIADTFFKSDLPDQQVEGVALYRQFLAFYPKHALACVAQLRIAEYHLNRMRSCERDQTDARSAVDELQKLLASYPDCAETETARAGLVQATDRLACHELKVAEYYRKTGEPRAAEHRLADLLRDFPGYSERCRIFGLHIELLHRLQDLDRARADLIQMEDECAGSPELERMRGLVRVAPTLPAETARP